MPEGVFSSLFRDVEQITRAYTGNAREQEESHYQTIALQRGTFSIFLHRIFQRKRDVRVTIEIHEILYTERSNNPLNPKFSNFKRQEEKDSRLKLGWFTRVSTINRNYSYVARVLAFSDGERRVEDFVKRVYLPARRVSWPGSNPWELFEASSASGIGSLKNRKKLGRKGKQRGKG